MCALLVGLPDVVVVGVGDWPPWLRVMVTMDSERPVCSCGGAVHRHGVREVVLVDLPVFGRPTRLVWRKQRWRCTSCGRCWCDDEPEIASARCALTTRAARWATLQVGRHGRSVADVARDLGCGWHAVMDAVVAVGEQLIDHPDRIGTVNALGFDETLFARIGKFRTQLWSTQIVDVRRGQLLDVVPGRDSVGPCRWLAGPGPQRLRVSINSTLGPDVSRRCRPTITGPRGPARHREASRAPASDQTWSHQNQVAAAAQLDACVWFGGDLWDHAAPSILVEEAGGMFTDHHGSHRLDTHTAVYSNGIVPAEILAAVIR